MVKMEESQIKGNFLLNSPRLVLHVLHFVGDFFYNPRASLARAAFKRDFLLVKLKAISFFWSKLRIANVRDFLSKVGL